MKIDISFGKDPSFVSDWREAENGAREYFTRYGLLWHRVGARNNKIWILTGVGHTGASIIQFAPASLKARITISGLASPEGTPWNAAIDDVKTHDVTIIEMGAPIVGHGQGVSLKHFGIDPSGNLFEPEDAGYLGELPLDPSVLAPWFIRPAPPPWKFDYEAAVRTLAELEDIDYRPFDSSKYVLSGTGQGGDQISFGVRRCMPEIYGGGHRSRSWRKQLYQAVHRPGYFVTPEGDIPTDVDSKWVLDASGWPHRNSKERPWFWNDDVFQNTFARDQRGVEWTFWDDEHVRSLSVLCEVYLLYRDHGLLMMLKHIAESLMLATPVEEKGTAHHLPGAARARGGEIEVFSHLFWCFSGTTTSGLQKRVHDRLVRLLEIQRDDWLTRKPHPFILRSDGAAPWEHGLWVKGLACSMPIPYEQKLKDQIIVMGLTIAGQIFDWFEEWPIDGWGTPYVTSPIIKDGKLDGWEHNRQGPDISEWCIPAMQLLLHCKSKFPPNTVKEQKLRSILSQWVWEREAPAFSGSRPTPWDRRSEWLMF